MLRLIYLRKALGSANVSEALEEFAGLKEDPDQPGDFSISEDDEWRERKAT